MDVTDPWQTAFPSRSYTGRWEQYWSPPANARACEMALKVEE